VKIGSVMQMENGIVRIVADSEIHSPAVSVQGHSVEVSGKIADCATLQVKAAAAIDLRASIQAASAAFSAASEIRASGGVATTTGDLVFSGPVHAALGKAEFSAGGDLVFNGPLSGSADFKLVAENGAVRLQENIGGAKARVKSLTIAARTIEQRAHVSSAGAVNYTGVVYLGGDISTMNHDIVFNGRVVRDHADTCRLTTSLGNGNVIFRSHLDADCASRNLNVIAGLGTVFFMNAIGGEGALGNLRVSADSISLNDIGTKERPGAAHTHMQATGGEGQLSLRGQTYHCKHYNWGAKKISLFSPEPVHFMSAEGGMFNGSMAPVFNVPLYFSAYGGPFQFTGIAGAGKNDVFVDARGGSVKLMRCEGVGALQIGDGSVELGDVRAGSIAINAGAHPVAFKGAVEAAGAIQVNSQGMSFMNSLQAQECTVRSPAGNVVLKGALDIAGPLQVEGKDVYVGQGFHAGDVKIHAEGSIYSSQLHSFATIERGDVNTGQALTDQETGQTVVQASTRLDSIRSDRDIFLHAKGAHVGRLEAPIVAEADGQIFIGCRESAAIKAPRNQLQLISGSEPRYYYLDGIEYADRFFTSGLSFFQQEEIFSLTQELLTHGRGDYLHPLAVQSRRALLFYTQDSKKTAQAD